MLKKILQALGALFVERKVRLSLEVEQREFRYFQAMAREEGVSFDDLVERGIRSIQHFKQQRAIGRTHMGFVTDRTKLDAELILFT